MELRKTMTIGGEEKREKVKRIIIRRKLNYFWAGLGKAIAVGEENISKNKREEVVYFYVGEEEKRRKKDKLIFRPNLVFLNLTCYS